MYNNLLVELYMDMEIHSFGHNSFSNYAFFLYLNTSSSIIIYGPFAFALLKKSLITTLEPAKFLAHKVPTRLSVEDVNYGDSAILSIGSQTLVRTRNHPYVRQVEISTLSLSGFEPRLEGCFQDKIVKHVF